MDKGLKLSQEIKEELDNIPNDKHNAIEKILISEYLIKKEIEKELRAVINRKKLVVSKGVIIDKSHNLLKGSGDCDILICKKYKGLQQYGDVVVVDNKNHVKAIMSVITRLNDLKQKSQFTALFQQRRFCEKVILLARKDRFQGQYRNLKLRRGAMELKKRIELLKKNHIKIFVLEKKGDFNGLVKYLRILL